MESQDRELRAQPAAENNDDEWLTWVRTGLRAQGIAIDEADVASVASIYKEYERLAAELAALELPTGQSAVLTLDLQS